MIDTCRHCGEEIDPEVCWCGDLMANHHSWCEHIPVPMGCRCLFSEPNNLSYLDINLRDSNNG